MVREVCCYGRIQVSVCHARIRREHELIPSVSISNAHVTVQCREAAASEGSVPVQSGNGFIRSIDFHHTAQLPTILSRESRRQDSHRFHVLCFHGGRKRRRAVFRKWHSIYNKLNGIFRAARMQYPVCLVNPLWWGVDQVIERPAHLGRRASPYLLRTNPENRRDTFCVNERRGIRAGNPVFHWTEGEHDRQLRRDFRIDLHQATRWKKPIMRDKNYIGPKGEPANHGTSRLISLEASIDLVCLAEYFNRCG